LGELLTELSCSSRSNQSCDPTVTNITLLHPELTVRAGPEIKDQLHGSLGNEFILGAGRLFFFYTTSLYRLHQAGANRFRERGGVPKQLATINMATGSKITGTHDWQCTNNT
jgi:hypothetical protein